MANCFIVFYYLHGKFIDWVIRLRLCEAFSLLQVSRHVYTSGIPEELPVYVHTMCRRGSGPDSSQHLKLSSAKALLRLFFRCQRNFNFMVCFKVIILKNFKSNMVKIPMKKKGTTNDISLFLDLINVKESHNFYVGVSKPCLFVLGCL